MKQLNLLTKKVKVKKSTIRFILDFSKSVEVISKQNQKYWIVKN